ncbi:MAG: alpha/beta fold hydrolase [Rhodobacteraceae bacterium]|nr:alpha/beta fold hydrolase [Paracoccaceae bacterium]
MRTPCGTFYVTSGPADAPAVVLLHGLGLNHHCWQWMAPELAQKFRVIRYDLHGHGQSADIDGTPDLRTLSGQLARVLDAVGADQAALVGFSMGGMIARRFAQDHPGRVRQLVILHSPHRRSADEQAAILARVEQARTHGPAATVDAALQRWFTETCRNTRSDLMAEVREWVLANDPAVYHRYYAILADGIDEIVAPQPPISCPTLVLTGDEDFGNGPAMAQAIAQEIPGAELLILKGLRHMALAEDPAAVNAPVQAFLSGDPGLTAVCGTRGRP